MRSSLALVAREIDPEPVDVVLDGVEVQDPVAPVRSEALDRGRDRLVVVPLVLGRAVLGDVAWRRKVVVDETLGRFPVRELGDLAGAGVEPGVATGLDSLVTIH
ncbi:MAG: hypothetical protein ABEH66_06365 [Halobacteriales archaeon]